MRDKGPIPSIIVDNLSKIYPSAYGQPSVALKSVSLSIETGSFLAIKGRSGSGKTTLLSIIGCLEGQFYGSIKILGQYIDSDDTNLRHKLRRDHFGFIFQNYKLIKRYNTLQNVELPLLFRGISKSERKERALHYIASVGLDGYENRKPHELSGGQQQRVAVARALAADPRILIADEPTGALDDYNSSVILELLRKLTETTTVTVIAATHDEAVCKAADRIVKLRNGEIDSDERK